MIAFTIFGRPVYRYGIGYAVTFLSGYLLLYYIVLKGYLSAFPKIQQYLHSSLDDFVTLIIFALLLGGRLGHVFFYDWTYYSNHLSKIFAVHDGGMAFLGGVIGVVLMLLYIQIKNHFSRLDMFVLGDLILCIVPLGIFLGRIANFLNQEMIGKAIETFPQRFQKIAGFLGLIHIYTQIDMIPRFNINITQAILEGFIPLVIAFILFIYIYNHKYIQARLNAGTIVSFFSIRYGVIRFFEEYTKDVGIYEYIYGYTISQRLCIALICGGMYIIYSKTYCIER